MSDNAVVLEHGIKWDSGITVGPNDVVVFQPAAPLTKEAEEKLRAQWQEMTGHKNCHVLEHGMKIVAVLRDAKKA